MICCRISTFPSQTTKLVVYRSPTSTTSDDLHLLQAIRHVATALGECLTVSDFNAPAVDWSNRTCPKPDGFAKNLLTTAVENFLSVYHPDHTLLGGEPAVSVGPCACQSSRDSLSNQTTDTTGE